MASVPDTNLTLDQFYSLAAGHLPAKDLPLVEKACAFVRERHGDKPYKYGGTFLQHVTTVAAILVSMKMDMATS